MPPTSARVSRAATRDDHRLRSPSEPLDVSDFVATAHRPPATRPQPVFPPTSPPAFLTTLRSREPVEFATRSACHNFNLQLAGAVLVRWASGGGRTRLVAPGHVSLSVAGDPFRAVVWPAVGSLTLHVRLPPSLIDRVREEEFTACRPGGGELAPTLGEWDTPVRVAAHRIAEAVRFRGTSDHLLLDHLQVALAVELVRRHDGPRARPRAAGRLAACTVRQVVESMHAGLGGPVRLADLAAVAGLSPFHFARSFKASVGVTPHRYLTEIRLAEARVLLATTSRPVGEIALSLGFDTPSHFCNAFRANVGVTPSTFRQRNS